MEWVFWICALWVVYAFAGYPAGVFLLARFVHRPVRREDVTPSVTVVIAAYDEVRNIVATVVNKLEQDYPSAKLNVIVVSDESSDGTDEAVRHWNTGDDLRQHRGERDVIGNGTEE